jgi:aryl carrier-like protein
VVVDLIAVLPVKLNKLVEKKLNSIKIIPLYYKWKKGNIEFIGIEKLIRNNFCSRREMR